MDDRIRRLRFRLEALSRGKRPRGVRYPAELRAEVVELVPEAGGVGDLAKALGLPPGTITRWQRRVPGRRRLRRITIAPGPAARVSPPSPSGPVLVTPQGWRVEGLDVATLLRMLQLRV
jgi:hypothetical protein